MRVSVACGAAAAMPPPTASASFAPAKSWATRLIASADTPEASADLARSTPFTAARSVPASASFACSPSSTMTLSIASATTPSAPGALRSHSSALAAVMDWRGSTATNVPARPRPSACMRAKAPAYATGLSHVSRKSAPKDRR